MQDQSRRRQGRPTTAVLTRESIADAALALIDDAGYAGLTMKALATRLGVAPSALYNHVDGKDGVLLLVQDLLMAQVDVAAFGARPLPEAVGAWARSYRDVFGAHPQVIPQIAVLPVTDAPTTLQMYDAVASAMRAGGVPDERVVPLIVALESFIYGSALDVASPDDIFDAGAHEEGHPTFTSAVAASRASGTDASDAAFEVGLSALVTLVE